MLKINEPKHLFQKKIKTIRGKCKLSLYLKCKNSLEDIYQEKATGIKIESKCDWYEFGEKSFGKKFFRNLEKQHPLQNQVPTILCG